MFCKQVTLHQDLPFEVKVPNATTLAALEEASNPDTLPGFGSVDKLFADLEN